MKFERVKKTDTILEKKRYKDERRERREKREERGKTEEREGGGEGRAMSSKNNS